LRGVSRSPVLLRKLFPGVVWNLPGNRKEILLTFDDGPVPVATEWILDGLRDYRLKALFFCLGERVEQYPELFCRIIEEGHRVGNHTYNHPDGWETPINKYLENVERGNSLIPGNLFRPPYGRLTPQQYVRLRKTWRIIMWSWLVYDFNNQASDREIWGKLKLYLSEGGIFVFHDAAYKNTERRELLEKTFREIKKTGRYFSGNDFP